MCRDVKVLKYMKRSVFLLHAREFLCRMKQFKEQNFRREVFVLVDRGGKSVGSLSIVLRQVDARGVPQQQVRNTLRKHKLAIRQVSFI